MVRRCVACRTNSIGFLPQIDGDSTIIYLLDVIFSRVYDIISLSYLHILKILNLTIEYRLKRAGISIKGTKDCLKFSTLLLQASS